MVCAVVQLAEGADGLDLTEVVAFCREAGLMTQKIPEQLETRAPSGPAPAPGRSSRRACATSTPSEPLPGTPASIRCPAPSRARPTGSSSSAPATSAARPWPRWSPGRWPDATTLADGTHAGRPAAQSPAPAPGPGTRASRWTRAPRRPAAGRLPGPPARGPPDLDGAQLEDQPGRGPGPPPPADPARAWAPTRPALPPALPFDPAAGGRRRDVPDPYYGDEARVRRLSDMIAAGCRGLVELRSALALRTIRHGARP